MTLNNFIGFETQGAEEFTSSSLPVFSTSTVRSGRASFSGGEGLIDLFDSVADAGTDYIVGVAVFLNPGDQTSDNLILFDGQGGGIILSVNDDKTIDLRDGNTILLDSWTPTLGVWNVIEIYYTSAGAWEWVINDVSEGSGSGATFFTSGQDTYRFSPDVWDQGAFFDDFYFLSGVTGISDRLGNAEVFGNQTGHDTDTDLDDALTTGEWNDTGDTVAVEESDANAASRSGGTSLSSRTDMDDANARGLGPGPASGSPDVSGAIIGAKYIFRLKRSNGSGTSMGYLFGNDGDGSISSGDIEGSLSPSYAIFEEVSEAAGVVPLASEDFQIGLEAGTTDTGGRNIFCSEAWAMLLHVPLAAPAFDPLLGGLALLGIGR